MAAPLAVLIGEGNDDEVLLNPLRWIVLRCTDAEVAWRWVDASALGLTRATKLSERVQRTLEHVRPQLLFVHRDADNAGWEARVEEIQRAVGATTFVPVVPVRATEAWFLLFEPELRQAVGRRSSRAPLNLPPPSRIETLSDPKRCLEEALRDAASARVLPSDRDRSRALRRISDLVEDWSPLRQLPAFQRLESDTRAALTQLGLPLLR